jgi:hypothetical protein
VVDTYLVRSLKRVHDQAAETLEIKEPTSSETIAERFNDLLSDFQGNHPDEARLHEIEPVEGVAASITSPHSVEPANESLRKIKLRTEQIADIFELDVGDFAEVDDGHKMRPIQIEQNTEVSQETDVSQTIEYTQLIDQVENAMVSDSDEEELKQLIRNFQDELEAGDTDESRLREIVGYAKEIGSGVGVQIGAKLTMLGLKEGYNLIP